MESILYDQLSAAINHTLPYLSLVHFFNPAAQNICFPSPCLLTPFCPFLPHFAGADLRLGTRGRGCDEALSKPTNPDSIGHMCFTMLPLKPSRGSQGSTAGYWRFIASVWGGNECCTCAILMGAWSCQGGYRLLLSIKVSLCGKATLFGAEASHWLSSAPRICYCKLSNVWLKAVPLFQSGV